MAWMTLRQRTFAISRATSSRLYSRFLIVTARRGRIMELGALWRASITHDYESMLQQ